jgi:pSer/pThr/pTyr-binding forkhead associated (FHA) protein
LLEEEVVMDDSQGLVLISADARGVLRWEDKAGKRRALYLREGDTAQIGREMDNDVVLDSSHVSRRHAVIVWREGAFEIADLGSTNGTQVNGEPVTQSHILRDSDVIRLYDVELTFYESGKAAPDLEAEPDVRKTLVVPPDAARPRLIISAGPQEGREFPIRAGKMVIGRATAKATCDIALQDRSISRPHAQVERQDDCFMLTDLDSANGTLVNGKRVAEPTALQDGDVIVLGETTLLFRAR